MLEKIITTMEVVPEGLELHISRAGSAVFNSSMEFPLKRRLNKARQLKLLAQLPASVELLHTKGYYNPVVVRAKLSQRELLRNLGFDTGSMPLMLSLRYPVAPCMAECDEFFIKAISMVKQFNIARAELAFSLPEITQSYAKANTTRIINLIDKLFESPSAEEFISKLDNEPKLAKLPSVVHRSALELFELYRESKSALASLNASLMRKQRQGIASYYAFFDDELERFVVPKRKLTGEELELLRIAFFDTEVPLYMEPEFNKVSWLAIAVMENKKIIDRVLMSLHDISLSELNGYRVFSVYSPGLSYSSASNRMAELLGLYLSRMDVEFLVAHNIAYDLIAAREAGFDLTKHKPKIKATLGFIKRMGLEGVCIADTLTYFLPHRGLPNHKLATVIRHFIENADIKQISYEQLEANERLLLGLELPERYHQPAPSTKQDALLSTAEYTIADVELMAGIIAKSDFLDNLAKISTAFNITTSEATYLPTAAYRVVERKFFRREHVTLKAASQNFKREMEQKHHNIELLKRMLNSYLAEGMGLNTKGRLALQDKVFLKPGVYTNAKLGYVLWYQLFRNHILELYPELISHLPKQELEEQKLHFAYFANRLVYDTYSIIASYAAMKTSRNLAAKETMRKLSYRIWKELGMTPERAISMLRSKALELGEQLLNSNVVAKSSATLYLAEPPQSNFVLIYDELPLLVVSSNKLVFKRYGCFNCFTSDIDEPEYRGAPIEKRIINAMWEALVLGDTTSFVDYFSSELEHCIEQLRLEDFLFFNKSKLVYELYALYNGKPKRIGFKEKPTEFDVETNLKVFFGIPDNFSSSRIAMYTPPELKEQLEHLVMHYSERFGSHYRASAHGAQCRNPSHQQAQQDLFSF